MSNLLYRLRLRANCELKALVRRPFARHLSPFRSKEDPPALIHCCYHKVGTVWFGRVLREVAAEFGMSLGAGGDNRDIREFELHQNRDVFIDFGSHVKLAELRHYRGSHMIRDPRDMIVSGYFYHRWTAEEWANRPRAEFRGMTYKEYLNSVDRDEGLAAEIRRNSFWIPHMAAWDFNNPNMFEIRYEEIIRDEERILRAMFEHYGFTERAVERCLAIARKYSFKAMRGKKKGGKSHLRSGKSGEWREMFKDEHKALFKELYPNVVARLGYDADDNW